MKKRLILVALALLTLLPARAQIAWEQVEPGVWKGIVGTPEEYSLLSVAGITPRKEGFTRLPEVTLPELANEIVGAIQDGKTSLRIPLQRKEQVYGFGLNFQTVHQRGKILTCGAFKADFAACQRTFYHYRGAACAAFALNAKSGQRVQKQGCAAFLNLFVACEFNPFVLKGGGGKREV